MKYTLKEIYDKSIAVHCSTEGKAKKLLRAFDKMGWTWGGRARYTDLNHWGHYREKTCYRPSDGSFAYVDWYKGYSCTVVEFEDAILPSDPLIDSIFSNKKAGVVVVKFSDGSKKILRLQNGDRFDLEKAVAIAIARKACGGYDKFKEEMENALKGGKK